MSTDRKQPGVAFWANVVLSLVLLYPISFGPACWTYSRVPDSEFLSKATRFFCSPILRAWFGHEGAIHNAIAWYAGLGAGAPLAAREVDGSVSLDIYSIGP